LSSKAASGGRTPWHGPRTASARNGHRGCSRWRAAVRPVEDIEKVVRQAKVSGAAILGVPIVETVKQAESEFVESTLTREHLVLAQTPQVFARNFERAFEVAAKDEYYGTDESSLGERLEIRWRSFAVQNAISRSRGPVICTLRERFSLKKPAKR
jgi:2-C-methyl-D-erythritol 4-phosphate cytidylyltransferase